MAEVGHPGPYGSELGPAVLNHCVGVNRVAVRIPQMLYLPDNLARVVTNDHAFLSFLLKPSRLAAMLRTSTLDGAITGRLLATNEARRQKA